MPSYTFIASAHAVVNAGLTPFLVDVDPTTLCITPSIVEKALVGLGEEPAAVLVVSAFGSPPEIEMWEDFEQRTGIPVVFDAAAALTSLKKIGHQPICVSLHATKVFGIGEGGAIISNDFNRNELLTAMTGFGFVNQKRESAVLGGNYRISEYSAAIGLAVLSTIDEKLDRIRKIVMSYRSYLNNTSVRFQEGVGYDWVAMTLNVIVEADAVTAVTERLDSENIPWRYWWGMGTDRHPAFSTVSAADLSNTRSVAPRVIGVPFYEDMTVENVSRVVKCLT
jgi:dTDP-4-amino-4,6-dideoxygalactose transaminase